jgi:type IV pilus assembly protein PilB
MEQEKKTVAIWLIDQILLAISQKEISETHIEPFENELRIRFRQEGNLVDFFAFPPAISEAITFRLKEMGQLNPHETRFPQDGLLPVKVGEKWLRFRISAIPTICGERIFLKVLPGSEMKMDLNALGMDSFTEKQLREALEKNTGMIIVAGPTGAGKTTTQCSILAYLNDGRRNILTAEWPVEYLIHGVNQVNCKFKEGYTDAEALRAFLKQNPDVIKTKIESLEVAELAFKGAAMGALILGSMHVDSAAEAFGRLINMGISDLDVATYVFLVQAQRLIRKLCPHCKQEYSPSAAVLRNLKINEQLLHRIGLPAMSPGEIKFYKHRGCEKCSKSGFDKHVLVCESLKITSKIREIILNKGTSEDLLKTALDEGMVPLREAGIRHAVLGNSSIEDVMIMR